MSGLLRIVRGLLLVGLLVCVSVVHVPHVFAMGELGEALGDAAADAGEEAGSLANSFDEAADDAMSNMDEADFEGTDMAGDPDAQEAFESKVEDEADKVKDAIASGDKAAVQDAMASLRDSFKEMPESVGDDFAGSIHDSLKQDMDTIADDATAVGGDGDAPVDTGGSGDTGGGDGDDTETPQEAREKATKAREDAEEARDEAQKKLQDAKDTYGDDSERAKQAQKDVDEAERKLKRTQADEARAKVDELRENGASKDEIEKAQKEANKLDYEAREAEGKLTRAEKAARGFKGAAKGVGEKALDMAKGLPENLFNAVVFMVPGIFEQAMLASARKAALFKTISQPVQFGNSWFQIPTKFLDKEEPANSLYIYAQLHTDPRGKRLNLTQSYLRNALFVTEKTSWGKWGQNYWTSPQFSGNTVRLNDGYTFASDGFPVKISAPNTPLIGSGSGSTVENYLIAVAEIAKSGGNEATSYEEVGGDTASGFEGDTTIGDQFSRGADSTPPSLFDHVIALYNRETPMHGGVSVSEMRGLNTKAYNNLHAGQVYDSTDIAIENLVAKGMYLYESDNTTIAQAARRANPALGEAGCFKDYVLAIGGEGTEMNLIPALVPAEVITGGQVLTPTQVKTASRTATQTQQAMLTGTQVRLEYVPNPHTKALYSLLGRCFVHTWGDTPEETSIPGNYRKWLANEGLKGQVDAMKALVKKALANETLTIGSYTFIKAFEDSASGLVIYRVPGALTGFSSAMTMGSYLWHALSSSPSQASSIAADFYAAFETVLPGYKSAGKKAMHNAADLNAFKAFLKDVTKKMTALKGYVKAFKGVSDKNTKKIWDVLSSFNQYGDADAESMETLVDYMLPLLNKSILKGHPVVPHNTPGGLDDFVIALNDTFNTIVPLQNTSNLCAITPAKYIVSLVTSRVYDHQMHPYGANKTSEPWLQVSQLGVSAKGGAEVPLYSAYMARDINPYNLGLDPLTFKKSTRTKPVGSAQIDFDERYFLGKELYMSMQEQNRTTVGDTLLSAAGGLYDEIYHAEDLWYRSFVNVTKGATDYGTELQQFTSPSALAGIYIQVAPSNYLNGFYVYTSPQFGSNNYFVASSINDPGGLTNGALGEPYGNQKYLVSLSSGHVYDKTGARVRSGNNPVHFAVSAIIKQLQHDWNVNPSDTKSARTQAWHALLGKIDKSQQYYEIKQNNKGYPHYFYNRVLRIQPECLDDGVYLYGDVTGMADPTDYDTAPHDFFVCMAKDGKGGFNYGVPLNSNTDRIVSLGTGSIYDRSGYVAYFSDLNQSTKDGDQMNPTKIKSALQQLMQVVLSKAKTNVTLSTIPAPTGTQLADLLKQNVAVIQEEIRQYNESLEDEDVHYPPMRANLVKTITRGAKALPAPYSDLRYLSSTGKYYIFAPSQSGAPSGFIDINVMPGLPNVKAKRDTGLGIAYNAHGDAMYPIQGWMLASLRAKYGIKVDANGAQKLMVPTSYISLPMTAKDKKLKPGQSGTYMMCSTNASFPSPAVTTIKPSPGAFAHITSYFYYNTKSGSFYCRMVDSANGKDGYIDLVEGVAYNVDGSPRFTEYPLAGFAQQLSSADTKLMLMKEKPFSMVYCGSQDEGSYVEYSNSGNAASKTLKLPSSGKRPTWWPAAWKVGQRVTSYSLIDTSQWNAATVLKNSITTPATYVVLNQNWDGSYVPDQKKPFVSMEPMQWCDLQYVSTGGSGSKAAADSSLEKVKVRMIHDGDNIGALLYDGTLYQPASKGGSRFKQVGGSATLHAQLQMLDETPQYVTITAGGTTSQYGLSISKLSGSILDSFKQSPWRVNVVTSADGTVHLVKAVNTSARNANFNTMSKSDIKEVPSGVAHQIPLNNMYYDKNSDRYFYQLQSSDEGKPFFPRGNSWVGWYVDLRHGYLFDSTGYPVGLSLQMSGLYYLLDVINVAVVPNYRSTGRAALVYRISQMRHSMHGSTGKKK